MSNVHYREWEKVIDEFREVEGKISLLIASCKLKQSQSLDAKGEHGLGMFASEQRWTTKYGYFLSIL